MELLQSVCSFPMIYKGKLIGVFNIDSKITGDAFYKEELEVIFILCNYLSATIKDIDYYHQIQYQKEFTRNILANMSSGVITINTEERISIFNQKASEMLNLEAVDVIGSDLRRLPSPLGDILYETMVEGKVFRRHETLIKPGNIPIGVSSHRILSEDNSAIGAVIVFTDLSDLKKLEEEKRKADNLEAMNNLIGKIAHEIKNPLTSIQTFTQLLEDKYKDEEFRKFFTVTVMQSVQQLNNLIDKLVIFSSPIDYRPDVYSVNDVIDDIINYVAKDLPAGIQLKKKALEMDAYVTIDKNFFIKALYYLILTSADRLSNDDSILLQINQDMKKQDSVEIAVKFSGEPLSDEEREMLLRPLLDIDAFGIELNVPISHKIIEDLHGTLSITSSKEGNALVITLPTTTKSGTSMKDGLSHG
jgi:nitrogen fixation/metabolism regulation signal transduction histidine kinase